MDTVDETIFENGTGLRISGPAEPAIEESAAVEPAQPATEEWSEQRLYRVVLNLTSGEWVEVGSFPDEQTADGHAREIATRLAQATEWPRVRGRYLRPETIVSIEISERRRPADS